MDRQEGKSVLKSVYSPDKRKKVLLVVGRMGTGKSGFVNTLIIPSSGAISEDIKHDLVEEKTSIQSVTTQCVIRKVHGSHELLKNPQQKLYVFDTPGLDSESAPSLISEQIDNILIENKCDIIGIAYVINLADRQVGGNNQSKIKQFLKVLKIKKDLKNELVFFILSKWDEICLNKKKEDIMNLQNQFYQLIDELGIPRANQKMIKWVNQRSMDPDNVLYFKQRKNGLTILSQQWKNLKTNVHRCQFIPFTLEDHMENVQLFWQNLKNRILSQIENQNIQYEKDPKAIYYDLKIKLRQWDILKDQGNVIQVFLKIPVFNIIFLLYSIGSWIKNKNNKLAEGFQNKLTIIQTEKKAKSMLIDQIGAKLQSIIIISLLKQIEIKQNRLIFNKPGKALKIPKLLVFYESQFAESLNKDSKMKVPIAFIYNQKLKEKIQIKFSFEKSQKKAIEYEQRVVQMFRGNCENKMKILVPDETVFFVKEDQEIFTVKLKIFCRLPHESSYCGLVKDLCVQMFGDYK